MQTYPPRHGPPPKMKDWARRTLIWEAAKQLMLTQEKLQRSQLIGGKICWQGNCQQIFLHSQNINSKKKRFAKILLAVFLKHCTNRKCRKVFVWHVTKIKPFNLETKFFVWQKTNVAHQRENNITSGNLGDSSILLLNALSRNAKSIRGWQEGGWR